MNKINKNKKKINNYFNKKNNKKLTNNFKIQKTI